MLTSNFLFIACDLMGKTGMEKVISSTRHIFIGAKINGQRPKT